MRNSDAAADIRIERQRLRRNGAPRGVLVRNRPERQTEALSRMDAQRPRRSTRLPRFVYGVTPATNDYEVR